MIHVIGLGPGNLDYLTKEGEKLILNSDVLIGGKRNLESITDFKGERIELSHNLEEIVTYIKANGHTKEISIIASGDPMIYGIGKYLLAHIPPEAIHIVPGISAIQYMFSRIQLDMNDLYITSSHGKVPSFDQLLAYEKVAMVTDSLIGPSQIAEEILKRNLKKIMWIGENLSYPNEKITKAAPEEVINKNYQMNVVVIVDEK